MLPAGVTFVNFMPHQQENWQEKIKRLPSTIIRPPARAASKIRPSYQASRPGLKAEG
jgi:hypothetical protein